MVAGESLDVGDDQIEVVVVERRKTSVKLSEHSMTHETDHRPCLHPQDHRGQGGEERARHSGRTL